MPSNTIYCTYLTVYMGNKLPPFYVGYTSKTKINNGYNGTVSSKRYKEIWCFERKNNPHLFKTRVIKEFTSRKEAQTHEHYLLKNISAHKNPLYINMHSGGCLYNYDHLTSKFNKEMSDRARVSANYKFTDPTFQKEMSLRAHNSNHPFHGGEYAVKQNKRRVESGTHNFLGGGERIKSLIEERLNRENVKVLRELAKDHNITLGKCWSRRKDEWIDDKILEIQKLPNH